MNIAGKGVVRRGLRAITMAVLTGTTQAFMSCGNCDTLPDSSVTSDIPLAQEMYHGRIFNPNEMEKLRKLTVLDRLNEDPDFHWGIERVLEHKSKRVTRRMPKTFDKEHLVTSTKVRLKVQFFDGFVQFVDMEAARADDPLPLIEYAKKLKLNKDPRWSWIFCL
jgi:hypothetical protein